MTTWRTVTLGDVIELQRGYDLPESERRPGKVPVCGSAGINGYHDTARAPGPGVTVGRSGASIGAVTFMREPYWPHNAVLFVTDFKGNDPRFVAALLQRTRLAELNSGSAQPSLNRNFVYHLQLRIPPLDAQRRIAGILSAYDDLIEVNTRRIAILEEMARRLFDEWFVKFRFPDYESVAFKTTPIGYVPEGWDVKAASEIIKFDPPTKILSEGEKPFVPMNSLPTNSMVVDEIEMRSGNGGSKFRNGDTLFARITPCLENGKTAFVNFLREGESGFGSTEFVVMRGRSVPPELVYLLARSESFRAHAVKSMSGATGRQRVRRESLEGFSIAEPPTQVVDKFTGIVRPMFGQVRVLALANHNLRAARDLLLPKLISGEIDLSGAERPAKRAVKRAAAE